jgi:invasion protein IalB
VAENFTRNRVIMIIVGVAVLALIAWTAYVIGERKSANGVARVQQAQQAPKVTRLPPQHYGSWTLQCVRAQQGRTACALGMLVTTQQRRGILLMLNVVRTRKGPAFRAITPPNALLPAGFTLTPDKGQKVAAPFARCLPRFCESMFLISDQLASGLKESQKAQVRFVAGNGRAVQFQIPVNGFGDGYQAWQNAMPPTPAIDASANQGQTTGPAPGETSGSTAKSAPAAPKPVDNPLNLDQGNSNSGGN